MALGGSDGMAVETGVEHFLMGASVELKPPLQEVVESWSIWIIYGVAAHLKIS